MDNICGQTNKFGEPVPEKYDLNGDGVVDDDDLALAESYEGTDDCVCTKQPNSCAF
jgi:hypothetical protein